MNPILNYTGLCDNWHITQGSCEHQRAWQVRDGIPLSPPHSARPTAANSSISTHSGNRFNPQIHQHPQLIAGIPPPSHIYLRLGESNPPTLPSSSSSTQTPPSSPKPAMPFVKPRLPYNLPMNLAIPNDLREYLVSILHIDYQERLTMSIHEQEILTGAHFDQAIDLFFGESAFAINETGEQKDERERG